MKNVITIARAFGSGGAEVGRRVASRLGFYYADRQLLYFAAKRLHLFDGVLGRQDVDGNNVRARFCQRKRHALAEAAGGSGDEGNFSVESETINN